MHSPPPVPHAPALFPGMQLPLKQQPSGHVEASHTGFEQAWSAQISSPVHSWHASPPVPQALAFVPCMHTPLKQQPFAHVLASHSSLLVMHAPDTQLSPASHTEQARPPVPQAISDSPDMHTSPSQQPSQFDGPQESSTHSPNWQYSPAPHVTHASPFVPHRDDVVCSTQLPESSQQPEQLEGPHHARSLEPPSPPDAQPEATKATPNVHAKTQEKNRIIRQPCHSAPTAQISNWIAKHLEGSSVKKSG